MLGCLVLLECVMEALQSVQYIRWARITNLDIFSTNLLLRVSLQYDK